MSDASAQYVAVCLVSEVASDRAKHVKVNDVPIAVVVNSEGVFAIRDQCSHADVPLSEGEVDGCMIECWLHGSQFDLRTGEPLSLPATSRVPVYPSRIVGSGDEAVIEVCATQVSP